MTLSRPFQQHADAVRSGDFSGNLRRDSLLPGEIAVRRPASQHARATAGQAGSVQPAGASLYPMKGGPVAGDAARPWWHLPAAMAVALAVYGLTRLDA